MLNRKVALGYAGAALVLTAVACGLGGWAWLLLWIAVSPAALAMAYAGKGAALFGKTNGRVPWRVRILLAPYLVCSRLLLHYYCLGLAPYAKVTPTVWIGRRLGEHEAQEIVPKGVTAVLDLTASFPESAPLRVLTYCNIQLLPMTVPTMEQLHDAVRFVQMQSQRGIVYIHSALSYSRSVGVVAAYLMAAGLESSIERAVDHVRAIMPQTRLDDEWIGRLREFEAGLSRGMKRM